MDMCRFVALAQIIWLCLADVKLQDVVRSNCVIYFNRIIDLDIAAVFGEISVDTIGTYTIVTAPNSVS